MRKSSKLISLVLALLMVMSVVQTAFPVLAVEPSPTYSKNIDPGVTTTCTDITWVASGANAYTTGNVIVAATPSGIPMVSGDFAEQSYLGEQASYTTITAVFENLPDTTPTVTSTGDGTGVQISTPTFTRSEKKYTWQVLAGSAAEGDNLEFSITFPFNGFTYTNRVYSYVRNIAQPAGGYVNYNYKVRKMIWNSYEDEAAVNLLLQLHGKNLYSSLDTFTVSSSKFRGYYNGAGNAFVLNSGSSYCTYGESGSDKATADGADKSWHANGKKAYADLFIDTSVQHSLADVNLRAAVTMIAKAGDNGSEVVNGLTAEMGSMTAGTDGSGTANSALGGQGLSKSVLTPGATGIKKFTGTNYNAADEYTILAKATAVDGQVTVHSGVAVGLRIHTIDKSPLRELVQKIETGTLYEDSNPLSAFGLNKGANPQSFYYKSGFSGYREAMANAMRVINQPNVEDIEIDEAYQALVAAYDNLALNTASYKVLNDLEEQAEEAMDLTEWYTAESLVAVEKAYDAIVPGCNILYQQQVNEWADALQTALDNLKVRPADYSKIDVLVAKANELAQNKAADGTSIYIDFSGVSAAVAAIRYDLTLADKELLDTYEVNLSEAINALVVRDADYSAVNLAVQAAKSLTTSYYTNFSIVRNAVNAVRYNLKITEQARVDEFAKNINDAIKNLIEKPADFTELEDTIKEANALVEEYYSPSTYKAVMTALNKCYTCNSGKGYTAFTITQQTKVDDLRVALREALNELDMLLADYSSVEEAIARWEAFSEAEKLQFSELSVQNVTTTIGAVVYGLTIDKQTTVNEYAESIHNAINNIDYISADYTLVNNAISRADSLDSTYYADFTGVENAIAAIRWDLGINRQDEVDAMAQAILDAIAQLVPGPADYTRVNSAIDRFNSLNKNYYTLDSVQHVEEVINSINWDLTKENQTAVILYALDINDAILELVEADADYTELNRVRNTIPTNLDKLYTQASIAPITKVLSEINWSLKAKDQDKVDSYVTRINDALSELVYLPGDYTEVDKQIQIGRDMIKNGVKQPDGTVYEIDAKSAAQFEEFVANIDRSYNIVQTEEIKAIANSVRDAYNALKYAETMYNAKITLDSDKTVTYPGDIVTVSVAVETDYYVAAAAIPVLYDANYYELVGSNVAEAYTFSGSYADGSVKGGSITSPAKGYPSSYTTAEKARWKYAYVTVTPSSNINVQAVVLDPAQTIVSFQLKVKEDLSVRRTISSSIWIDSEFIKTASNLGGKLYVGRFQSSVVDMNIVSYGQTFNLDDAVVDTKIYDPNSPADSTELEAVLADAVNYPAANYTSETYAPYQSAVANGNMIMDNIADYTIKEQKVLDAAVKEILEKQEALVLKDADTSALEVAVNTVLDYGEEYYTPDSYKAFADAVAAGQAILAEEKLTILDNGRIDEATDAINDAIANLVYNDFSYWDELFEALFDIVPYYIDDESKYDEDALMDYYDALDALDIFSADEIDMRNDEEGLELLNDFKDKYIALEKSSITQIMKVATPEYSEDVYTAESYAEYAKAYDAANAILADTTLTYADVEKITSAANTLEMKYNALEFAPFEYEERLWAALDLYIDDESIMTEESVEAFYEAYDALDAFTAEYMDSWTALNNEEALELIINVEKAFENLAVLPADVEALKEAIANVPEYDSKYYTEESYEAYATALANAKELLWATFEQQDAVDEAEAALVEAFDALELKPFTMLDAMTEAIAVTPEKDESAYFPTYWDAYVEARDTLQTMIDEADTYSVLDDEAAAEAVDAYNKAIKDLEEKGVIPEADYTAVNDAIANATAKLEEMLATGNALIQSTVDALNSAIDAVDFTLSGLYQDQIDAYATAINEAAEALAFVPVVIVEDETITLEGGYVFGFKDVTCEDDILNAFGSVGGATVKVEATDNGYGTGTVVTFLDAEENVIAEYVVVVTADANGDGFVDAYDVSIATDFVNNFDEPETEAVKLALDTVADGWLDAIDLAYIIAAANGEF